MPSEALPQTLSERMREARHASGLSQQALAEAVGVSIGAIRKWESGLSEPSVHRATRIARALGVTLHDLVDWENVEVDLRGGQMRRFAPTSPFTRHGLTVIPGQAVAAAETLVRAA